MAVDAPTRGYLEAHCFECHDGATKKGGLDLESVCASGDLASRFDVWVQVHDRVASGEMPPKSRQERPPEGETAAMLRGLDERLHQADLGTVAKNGRALLRRLTAQEYENALRDLLQLPSLRIKHLLPEDERRHGYNKIGRALDLSNVPPVHGCCRLCVVGGDCDSKLAAAGVEASVRWDERFRNVELGCEG
jgi:hypothetical protein